jgi:outer membrane receptor for ferrienterochelin and colicins
LAFAMHLKKRRFSYFAAALYVGTGVVIPISAIAQDSELPAVEDLQPIVADPFDRFRPRQENGRLVYEASQFSVFKPQTAADMVERIPGFTITEASGDRGLGEATQNVLFNGQRISGKSNNARTVLSRTPAATVVQIEIADGASLNIPGLSGQVANIITKTTGISGTFAYRTQIRADAQPQYFSAEIGIAGKIGAGDFTLALKNNDNSYRGGGLSQEVARDANGTLLYTNDRKNLFAGDRPTLSGSYARTSGAGSVFNSNLSLFYNRERRRQTFDRETPNQPDLFDLATGKNNTYGLEVSADYEFDLAGGRLKLIGLQSNTKSFGTSTFRREFSDGQNPEASIFDQEGLDGESIARAEYRWKAGSADWQISAEGAYNFLDVQSDLFVLDDAGSFQVENLDNATSRVAEKRGALIISYGRPLAKNLTLQTQLGGEYSQIAQSGLNGLSRQFVRPKGLVSLTWKASPRFDASARFERKVGQLNFGDFIASVDLRDDNDNAGNPELVPPQSWLAGLELNRNFGPSGSLKVKLEREWFTDIIDQVPIGLSGEAPGNLPSAQRWSAEANATILLDPIGLRGMKFELSGYLQRGRLQDQLTGFFRPINGERRYTYEVNFRHDIPGSNWAYGVIIEDDRNAPFFRLNSISSERNNAPFVRVFVEHKNILGLKARAALVNLADTEEIYSNTFYDGRRTDAISEVRSGRADVVLFARFSISGTF